MRDDFGDAIMRKCPMCDDYFRVTDANGQQTMCDGCAKYASAFEREIQKAVCGDWRGEK